MIIRTANTACIRTMKRHCKDSHSTLIHPSPSISSVGQGGEGSHATFSLVCEYCAFYVTFNIDMGMRKNICGNDCLEEK